ncbi:MAG: prepilin-type N-terminal cleavage/methylation domain-containing protein [Pseudomonadota bacterium]|nr:prepilin-type N-terminal cleavage/methylation domain-containing protein [Pseudomonadota bacterium]
MENSHRGFSLIEAMVSVLVLSIGLLGLCRLQAQLWSSSNALHASAAANLLASSYLEKAVASQLTGIDLNQDSASELVYAGTLLSTALSVANTAEITEAEIRVQWSNQTGAHSIQIGTATDSHPAAADTRWLLPALSQYRLSAGRSR